MTEEELFEKVDSMLERFDSLFRDSDWRRGALFRAIETLVIRERKSAVEEYKKRHRAGLRTADKFSLSIEDRLREK